MITRANRGRRYPIDGSQMAKEARYLTTAILQMRADHAERRYKYAAAKAFAAFRKRHDVSVGIPPSWRDIARNRIHSAGIAEQHAEFYRSMIAYRKVRMFPPITT